MIIVGDIGNTETKICLINPNNKIIKKIIFDSKNINNTLVKKHLSKLKLKNKKIKKPTNANTNPHHLKRTSFISFNFNNILFIFDGNKAYKIPSIKRKRPNAMINSFIIKYIIVI